MTVYQIGRGQQSDIVINDKSVSRQHAELHTSNEGEYLLIDLDSTNGTCVREGGKWVEIEKATVRAGERILIGEVITSVGDLLGGARRACNPENARLLRNQGPAPARRPARNEPSFAVRRTPSGRIIDSQGAPDREPADDAPPADPPSLTTGPRSVVESEMVGGGRRKPVGRRWLVISAIAAFVLLSMSAGTYAYLNYGDQLLVPVIWRTQPPASVKPKPAALRPTWQKVLGGPQNDVVHALATTRDGGSVLAGTTSSAGPGAHDLWVVRLDRYGRMMWRQTFGGNGDEFAVAVRRARGGGFIVAGSKQARRRGPGKIWIIRLNAKGGLVWERTIDDDPSQFADAIVSTRDGGYVVAAQAYPESQPTGRARIIRLDSKGRPVWSRYYGQGRTRPSDIQRARDGGFIVAGTSDPDKTGRKVLWVLRLDARGDRLWEGMFRGRDNDSRPRIRSAKNRQYIVAVSTETTASETRPVEPLDIRLLRLNDHGEKLWEYVHVTASADRVNGLVLTRGGIIVAGTSDRRDNRRRDLWVARFDISGRLVWQRRYGGTGDDMATDLRQHKRGLIVAGRTGSHGAAKTGPWILKLDKAGRLGR